MSYDHDRDGTHTEVDGCESHFRNLNHDTFMAIRYEKNKLTVYIILHHYKFKLKANNFSIIS